MHSSVSSKSDDLPAGHEDPDLESPAGEQSETPSKPDAKAAPHRVRWAFLCITAAAISATFFLLFQLRLEMPLPFAGTLVLTLLVAAGLPLLLIALLGRPLSARGLRYAGQFILVCLLLSIIFAAMIFV